MQTTELKFAESVLECHCRGEVTHLMPKSVPPEAAMQNIFELKAFSFSVQHRDSSHKNDCYIAVAAYYNNLGGRYNRWEVVEVHKTWTGNCANSFLNFRLLHGVEALRYFHEKLIDEKGCFRDDIKPMLR